MQTPGHVEGRDTHTKSPYGDLSPFELKDELIRFAKDYTRGKAATIKLLNAGRGNPNWLATTPREAFFLLGQFALEESKRVWDEPDLGGMPQREGCVGRLRRYLDRAPKTPGSMLLRRAIDYGVNELGFEPDAFVHELVDSILGDNYPEPDRMLVHAEAVVRRYLEYTLLGEHPPAGEFKIFAVEGATAAMCYVFKSLMANRLLKKGDTIALGTPIFTPYIEMPKLADFGLETVEVRQSEMTDGRHTWQYPDEEIRKLEDPKIKAFFLVNPSNPASIAMHEETCAKLAELVRTKRPDLIILTDDVYGTFADGFRSIAADLPHNTILVYSYSKLFGCTGVRLGVVALHEQNVLDEKIAQLPVHDRQALRTRYESIVEDPDSLRFIDRMVADSRDVALNHTAGLSLPQQVQMTLFSLFTLLDEGDTYIKRCRNIVRDRLSKLAEGLGLSVPEDPHRVGYYVDLDLEAWGRKAVGEDFMRYVEAHRQPIDVVVNLAREFGTVLLNGSGFQGPAWSVRVSLANLDTDDYATIGRHLAAIVRRAIALWRGDEGASEGDMRAQDTGLGAYSAPPR
jgi:aspartate 4-decarboxylase